MDGIRKKNTMMIAVHGEELVVGVRIDQVALRRQQLQPDQPGEDAPEEEHHGDGDDVENGDALMVLGEQPGLPAVLRVQVIRSLYRGPWIL